MSNISNLDSDEAEPPSKYTTLVDNINKHIDKNTDVFFLQKTSTYDLCFKCKKYHYMMFELYSDKEFYDNYENIKSFLPKKYDGCYESAIEFFKKAGYESVSRPEDEELSYEELRRLNV